jgi:hypothetical protein
MGLAVAAGLLSAALSPPSTAGANPTVTNPALDAIDLKRDRLNINLFLLFEL